MSYLSKALEPYCTPLYKAVANGDHESMVLNYALAMKEALVEWSQEHGLLNLQSIKELDSIIKGDIEKSNENGSPSISYGEQETMYYSRVKLSNCISFHSWKSIIDGKVKFMNIRTLLHLACILDSPFCLAILLAMGGDPSGEKNSYRILLLHEAARYGSINCLRLLLDLSYQEVVASWSEPSAHSMPATDTHPSLSSTLSTIHNIMHFSSLIYNKTINPFHASYQLLSKIDLPPSTRKYLLNIPIYRDGNGNTALHLATMNNRLECVKVLLSKFSPNLRNKWGWTPLHNAAYSNAVSAVRILLERGADVDAIGNDGMTPLCHAARTDALTAAWLLLQSGADVHMTGHDGSVKGSFVKKYTPLHYCAHYDSPKTAQLLMDAGAKWDVKDWKGRMVHHLAIARGSASVVKEMLTAGVIFKNDDWELKKLVPKKPDPSPKLRNCSIRANIDECHLLLDVAAGHWCPDRHGLLGPVDRKAIKEVLMVGKRMEKFGVYRDLWIEVLSFCKRGWFEKI